MKKLPFLFALILSALAIAACGDSDNDTTGEASTTPTTEEKTEEPGAAESREFSLEADPSGALTYNIGLATIDSARVTIHLTNKSSVPHDVSIEEDGGGQIGKTEVVAEGEASTTVDLKPGKYTFYCSVPGHRDAGMYGTLTVE